MHLYLVSGDGQGAGKTTFATMLAGEFSIWSIAGSMRDELQRRYPNYNWFNKQQEYKNGTRIKEYGNGRLSMRDVLCEYGQNMCENNPTYWVEKLADRLALSKHSVIVGKIAVDDVRKLCELDYLRQKFKHCQHFHVCNDKAIKEPLYENDALREAANYRVSWTK